MRVVLFKITNVMWYSRTIIIIQLKWIPNVIFTYLWEYIKIKDF